ncbi:PRAME family member 8-like isoform X1 [Rattus norvegicus]|uniref:PRAME family member 8-like isoform X1 n=1 Tax=Rattus norvegicus TaxID=10116 RepID=UPI0000DA3B09|nr:PRAME family member 8-like isoform X1 [Rattus norvegicus]
MSIPTPLTLQMLARQSLLRNEDVAISSLEEMPNVLFPALFKEAFEGRQTKLVKETVATWPLPCLPVGALMNTQSLETFQAVLDGVDMRLTRKFHPRRTKLQVLDLRNAHHAFWNIWAGAEESSCSAENWEEKQVVKVLPRYALRRQRVKVIVELCIWSCLDETQAYFLKWAQQRKGSLHFCCTQMTIWELPLRVLKEILNVFNPQHITELELNTEWNLSDLAHFAAYFGKMINLQKVFLAPLHKMTLSNSTETRDRETKCIKKFISQFSKFNCLQHLCMFCVHFLRDHMNQVLGCLMTPLETLSITYYLISQKDLDSLSRSQSLFQLKHLDLRGVVLCDLDIMPLRGLLEKVADTLETLDLQWCRMTDSQLYALLPALRHCCQLTMVNFYSNNFSMHILKDLLQHTINWSRINVEQYPAPLECYDDSAQVSVERFALLCPELMDTLRAIRQPKSISFATDTCQRCGECCVYHNGSRLCCCWQ